MIQTSINVAVLGASGYTGAELLRLLCAHPNITIKAITANRHAGKPLTALFPSFHSVSLPSLQTIESVDFNDINVVFCCLPHAHSHKIIKTLPESVRVIDLSADFRLQDVALYEKWYGPHQAPTLQPQAVYGLSEWFRDDIAKARIIACPGCYPTASLLPLWPLAPYIIGPVIIDAKSGVSGAGRDPKENIIAAEVQEGMTAYAIGKHRHQPEIQQGIELANADNQTSVTFTPHLIPMNRGILATTYITLQDSYSYKDARNALVNAYSNASFVTVLPEGIAPHTRSVRASNQCQLNVFETATPNQLILVSAIDNLIKGASGQAVQNMNIAFGLPEETGLPLVGLMP